MTAPVSYTLEAAASASGYSIDVIRRAVRAGDLATARPKVNGKPVGRPVVLADELQRWVRS